MSKNLVIVESPAKANTIKKYLGADFEVLASYGHVRDLVPKNGAVDTDHGFRMNYEIIDRNEKHVDKITKALKKADTLYLATDPDREGEAISWHLHELLKEQGLLGEKAVHRVVFYEITKSAVQAAMQQPRTLSYDLINAQQARRALDYLVGFNLSPLLWKKVKRGLSAGRVQSPALRLLVEREDEIDRFITQEYWTIEADLSKTGQAFSAKLTQLHHTKVEQFSITSEDQAMRAENDLQSAAQGELVVSKIEKKQRKRHPAPPLITSTLQQEAARKLGFTTRKSMQIAQQLYEGIDLGSGPVGLITYMRTDSVSLAKEAVEELREVIKQQYGSDNLPETPREYKTKSKNAQEAHEAIRPTSAQRLPDEVKKHLSPDQFRLYQLIWKRTVASQMTHATLDTVAVDLACGDGNNFRANGSAIRHPGFMAVYMEGKDDDDGADKDEKLLPLMEEGEKIPLAAIRPEQHFTEPPPRFTEASLVKALEEFGIGRPSTYASIISTLLNREYAELENKRFHPTDIGKIVNNFLTKHFTDYVDYEFTAKLEDELDEISRGEQDWVPVLQKFWDPFNLLVRDKDESVSREEVIQARELGTDPDSGKPVSVRMGRFGPYVQIGTKDDEDKPRFAGLRPGQKMDHVTLDEAMELFKLPRSLGETESGEKISTNFGRFGPYVKYGSKYVSLKDDDPYSVTLEKALQLIAEKQLADANRVIKVFEAEGIEVLNGRYGPYITDGKKNAKIPKDVEPASLDLATCQKLIAEAPEKKGSAKSKKSAAKSEAKTTATKKTATTKSTAKTKSPKTKTATKAKATAKTKTATTKKKTSSTKAASKKTSPESSSGAS